MRLDRLPGLAGLALSLVACDPCAGYENGDKIDCCAKNSDAPSCSVDKPSPSTGCSAIATDVTQACEVQLGSPTLSSFDSDKPGLQTRYFTTKVCDECRNLELRLALAEAKPSQEATAAAPLALSVQVLNAHMDPVVTFEGQVTREDGLNRVFGVTPGGRYYVRVGATSGGAASLSLRLTGNETGWDVEPNGSFDQALSLAPDSTVRGDHSGVDTTFDDADYFRFQNAGSAGTLHVSARRLVPLNLDAPLKVGVFDELHRAIVAERAVGDTPIQLDFGVAVLSTYFVRVTIGAQVPRQVYSLEFAASSGLFEMEPNDTAANAQMLAPDVTISGGYSALRDMSDDDIFKVAVPNSNNIVIADLEVDADAEVNGALELAIIDGGESVLAQQTIMQSGKTSLKATLTGGSFVYARVRTSASFVGLTYNLTVHAQEGL